MKCTNCGSELTGKFCMNCGTSAPDESVPDVEPVPMDSPNTDFPTFDNMPLHNDVTPQNTSRSQEQPYSAYQSESVNQTNGSYQSYDSNSYNNQYNQYANNGYTGQQVSTNAPYRPNGVQGGKKKMSGGKIAAIIVSIVLGVMLIFGIIIGVIIWKAYNTIKTGLEGVEYFSSEIGSALEEYGKYETSDFEFNYDFDSDTDSASESESENSSDADDDSYLELYRYISDVDPIYDDNGWIYVTDPYDDSKVIIVGLNTYTIKDDITSTSYTITIPESLDGKKVEQVFDLFIMNPGLDKLSIKLVIPGTVKIVHDYAIDYSDESLTEVVFEEGVEKIGKNAVFYCPNIKKITVAESVKTIGDCALGFTYKNSEEAPMDDVVIVTKKGSAADDFAKENNMKVEYN